MQKIPMGWKNGKFNEFIELLYGSNLPKSKRKQGFLPVYGSNGITDYHNASLIKGPGIILGRKGSIGIVHWSEKDFWPIDTTYYVNPKENIDLKWAYYKLQVLGLNKMNTASGIPGLNRNEVYSLKINVPTLLEQIRIATILSKVDEEIEKVEQIIEQTEKLKKGLMQELLTKGIGHKKFKKSVLGEIPEEWEVSTLNEISENLDNKRIPITKSKRKHGTYPYYGASGIVDYVNDYIFDEELLLISEDGANLLDRNYPIAFTATGKFWVNNHSHIHRFNDKYLQKIIEFYLNNKNLEKYLTGMAQPKLNKQRLFCIPIPIPKNPKEIKSISIILSTIDEKFIKYKQISLCLNNLKKGIMSDLLSGKKRVI